ncbi:hypothetical protein THASP1DRAFT_27275 [Thamnocephalis sphaerospora]|uniref:Uncharacterized protein n=1 Tax=Thamnocephalis sphaerospora TaxID=78915 RepID=A0A4P9XX74_9FUNG|nr:hypothetical protein THASP1DRAFT_27275 [Thamnocephalis sphaerospora]|eukprot:RKP10966.1 hypothetical protein THASP1DRAFT_27275 [Thamnocephalis sphaerospora]
MLSPPLPTVVFSPGFTSTAGTARAIALLKPVAATIHPCINSLWEQGRPYRLLTTKETKQLYLRIVPKPVDVELEGTVSGVRDVCDAMEANESPDSLGLIRLSTVLMQRERIITARSAIRPNDTFKTFFASYLQRNMTKSKAYHLELVNCSPVKVEGLAGAIALRTDSRGSLSHLEQGLADLPLLYAFFAIAVWPLVLTVWCGIQTCSYKRNVVLYRLIGVLPCTRICLAVAAYFYLKDFASNGFVSVAFPILLCIVVFLAHFAEYFVVMLAAKGWCITQTRLSHTEWRLIAGTAVAAAALRSINQLLEARYISDYVNIFGMLVVCYSWVNVSHQRKLLHAYITVTQQHKVPAALVLPYQKKSRLLFHFITVYMLASAAKTLLFTWYFGQTLLAKDSLVASGQRSGVDLAFYGADESISAVFVLAFVLVLRPRAFHDIDLSANQETAAAEIYLNHQTAYEIHTQMQVIAPPFFEHGVGGVNALRSIVRRMSTQRTT